MWEHTNVLAIARETKNLFQLSSCRYKKQVTEQHLHWHPGWSVREKQPPTEVRNGQPDENEGIQWRMGTAETLILQLAQAGTWEVGNLDCKGISTQGFLCLGTLFGGTQLELLSTTIPFKINYLRGMSGICKRDSASGNRGWRNILNS